MKRFILLCCLLVSVTAMQDKKTSLEDIERDSLKKTQKSLRTILLEQLKPPTNYGFVATKSANDYTRQQPKDQYLQPQYVPQQQQQNQYSSPAQRYLNPEYNTLKYSVPQQYIPSIQQYSTSQVQAQSQVYPVPAQTQQYYYQPQQQQTQYQQYENVQYVTDNNIAQPTQSYYGPQYVYLQQYSAPSTSIQTVVDPKSGGLQYVMYIPTYVPKAEPSQNYENVVYSDDASLATSSVQSQGDYQPQVPPSPIQYIIPQKQQIQYVATEPQPKTRYYTQKHEPKSLLDSYVPSYVQLQYLKQQQHQAQINAIQQQSTKLLPSHQSSSVGKIIYANTNPNTKRSPSRGSTVTVTHQNAGAKPRNVQ